MDEHHSELVRGITAPQREIHRTYVRQRLECGLEPEIEESLVAVRAAIHDYESKVVAGENPSYSSIEIAKVLLAEAYLSSMEFQVHPRSLDELKPKKFSALVKQERSVDVGLGFVYLMRNNRTGCTKIGFSNNPSYREKTLQSEEPDIEMVHFFKGMQRLEKKLHIRYAEHRVRGEWFKLNAFQVDDIIAEFPA